jgi:hypothetical protein
MLGKPQAKGTWKYVDGTGIFQGLKGGGTYKGRMTSPTEVEIRGKGRTSLRP